MSETVKVEVDLDLDPKLAKEKLDTFKKSVQNEAIPVKLDLDNAKGDALKLKNITKDYKTAGYVVPALKGVSLNFRRNEFVSILGPSGCGKTTLLNIIGGLDQ